MYFYVLWKNDQILAIQHDYHGIWESGADRIEKLAYFPDMEEMAHNRFVLRWKRHCEWTKPPGGGSWVIKYPEVENADSQGTDGRHSGGPASVERHVGTPGVGVDQLGADDGVEDAASAG